MTRHLFLTAGHQVSGGHGTGAVSPFGDEGLETVRFRDALDQELKNSHGIQAITENIIDPLGRVVSWINGQAHQNSITVDIHFNAGPPVATGVEVLIPANPSVKEISLATDLANILGGVMCLKKRTGSLAIPGVKLETEGAHTRLAMLSGVVGCNILVETCFITNPDDMKNYHGRFDVLVKEIARVLASHLKSPEA